MANGIGRIRTLGFSKETSYGTGPNTASYYLQVIDTPRINIVQNKAENIMSMGSKYATNAVKNTTRMANFSLNIKVSENALPLLLAQSFQISTATVSGDANVYRHTLSYSSTTTQSYVFFLQDPDRTSIKMNGVKLSSFQFGLATDGFVTLQLEGMGQFPVTWTNTVSATTAQEFVGRNATYSQAPTAQTYTTTSVISATINHTTTLSADTDNFALGSADVIQIANMEDRFEQQVTALFPDFALRDYYTNNTKIKNRFVITDTDRFVVGSVANTNPNITFEYPSSQIITWNDTGGIGELLKQELTTLALRDSTIATSPAVITITNNVASY